MTCTCFIVPPDVLRRFSTDRKLSAVIRDASDNTANVSAEIRRLRAQAVELTRACAVAAAPKALAKSPAVTVYDCRHSQTLPGTLLPKPSTSSDVTAKRTYKETRAVATFYRNVFKRNSIDAAGMTLLSSIHFGTKFNNAMWNGSQMLYGDGDNQLFVDFTAGNDVIGHELTHGVTQHSLQLAYAGDAGGLNESLSDCFGSMFRQWQAKQSVGTADWLIGSDIIGPVAKRKGYTCLRDMADPAAAHCLAAQPTHYSQLTPATDPHYSSGPPNLAFYTAAMAVGGRSWEKVGQIWYRAMTGFGPSPHLSMKAFANRTRQLAKQMYGTTVADAVGAAWKQVGL